MNIDILIIVCAWFLTIILLILFVPKDKLRHGIVIFLFKQLLTWVLGLIVAELHLIEYPVRSFPYAIKSSFDFEYFVYPAFCVLFNLHFPKTKSKIRKFMHYVYYCTGISVIELILERNTNVIHYINWHWYISWITLFFTFYISRKFYIWFFKLNKSK